MVAVVVAVVVVVVVVLASSRRSARCGSSSGSGCLFLQNQLHGKASSWGGRRSLATLPLGG